MKTSIFSLLAVVLLLTVPVRAQKVTTDHDQTADFSRYHTYAWAKGTPAPNPLTDQRIVAGVEAQLAAKGLQKASDPESADLLVVYHAAADTETQLNTYNMGGWGGWGWGMGGMATTSVEKIPIGKLIVDLADPKNKRFVWRGTASGTISSKPEKVQKMLDKALTKMFQNYPPKAKK